MLKRRSSGNKETARGRLWECAPSCAEHVILTGDVHEQAINDGTTYLSMKQHGFI